MEDNSIYYNSIENYIAENTIETTTNTVEDTNNISYSEQLTQIHEDIGFVACILIFFVIVLLCHYAYKFFNMFFVI